MDEGVGGLKSELATITARASKDGRHCPVLLHCASRCMMAAALAGSSSDGR
jgi:hypothetical protein